MISKSALAALVLTAALGGCAEDQTPQQSNMADLDLDAIFVWPENLKILGTYPSPGNFCRRIGETHSTKAFEEPDATLVGCPSAGDARTLGGKVVGSVSGITLVSIPNEEVVASEEGGQADAKAAGTGFDAAAQIPCSGVGNSRSCNAGVQRGSERITVYVTPPKGGLRTLIFSPQGKFITAATAHADGSAAYKISSTRDEEWTEISVGPERYRVPDALVNGE